MLFIPMIIISAVLKQHVLEKNVDFLSSALQWLKISLREPKNFAYLSGMIFFAIKDI